MTSLTSSPVPLARALASSSVPLARALASSSVPLARALASKPSRRRSLGENGWTPRGYALYRALLGSYLFVHFALLIPYGAELFSSAGMLPHAEASPLFEVLPSLLWHFDAPWVVTTLLGFAALSGAALALGVADRAAAVAAWFVLACTFGRNPLIANPSLPYVGWLLLAHVLVPKVPSARALLRRRCERDGWKLPAPLFAGAWIVMATGYTYSGLAKLGSASWLDGSAVARILENPLTRPGALREALLALPPEILQVATWGALAAEIAFLPLALFARTRPLAWAGLLGMHLGLIVLIDFADLTFGMVVLHAFTFDPRWVAAGRARSAARVSEGAIVNGLAGRGSAIGCVARWECRSGNRVWPGAQGAAGRDGPRDDGQGTP